MAFTDIRLFRQGSLASGLPVRMCAFHLAVEHFGADGWDEENLTFEVAGGFTNGDATVTHASLAAADDDKLLFDIEERKIYQLNSGGASTSELDRPYEGATGSKDFFVTNKKFTGGIPFCNPPQKVLGDSSQGG